MENNFELTPEQIEAFERLQNATLELWEKIQKWAQGVLDALHKFFEPFITKWKRINLYNKCRSLHFPHWLSFVIAQNCPRRWLPNIAFEINV